MDIQISSNFERLLFDLLDRDGAAVARTIASFRKTGRFTLAGPAWRRATAIFSGASFDDDATSAAIAAVHRETGMLIDPHSAVGIAAGRALHRPDDGPLIALATAHPAKFPEAVEAATGTRPPLPDHLADLFEREERCTALPNELAAVREHIRAHARPVGSHRPAGSKKTNVA